MVSFLAFRVQPVNVYSNESPLAEGAAVSPFRIMKSYAHAGRFQKRYTWLVIYIRLEEKRWNEKKIKA
jgi:hypothetical protein